MLLCLASSAAAQVSIGIGLPNVSIGINLPLFPQLDLVPGYPVYYAPQVNGNYFFYDGMYWVYQNDNWYASSWYNGPWGLVHPYYVPLFILRIPVSYYRQPPAYFRGWRPNAPPRWGQHWGRGWEQRRSGWDRWNRGSAPTPAPLPVYQRQYSRDRYPQVEQQQALRTRQYNYQPRETAVRQHFQQLERRAPASVQGGRQEAPRVKKQGAPPVEKQETPRVIPRQQGAPSGPNSQPPRRGGEHVQKTTPDKPALQQRAPAVQKQRRQPAAAQQQQAPRMKEQIKKQQDRGGSHEPNRGQGQGQNKDDERGRGRDK